MTHARRGVRSEGPRYNTRLLRSRADLAFFFPASHNRSPVWESCQFARYLDRPFYITRRCPFTPASGTIGLKDAIHLHRRSLVTPTKYPHARVKRIIIDWQLIIGGRVRRTSRELRALSSWNGNGKFSSFVARTSIFSPSIRGGISTNFYIFDEIENREDLWRRISVVSRRLDRFEKSSVSRDYDGREKS